MKNLNTTSTFYSTNELLNKFKNIIVTSDLKLESLISENGKHIANISDCCRKFELHFVIKNISSGGWKEKQTIKRIQIGNIKDGLVSTNKIRTHMLCGIIEINKKFLIVVWDSYLYTNHATNRSCYITNNAIDTAEKNGYAFVNEHNQYIWLSDDKHFNLLIRDYINYNYVG